jgi:hypothetical protein
MALDKNSREYKFMADYWKFMKKFWDPQPDQTWWDEFYNEMNKLFAIYNNEFALEHLYTFAKLQINKNKTIVDR